MKKLILILAIALVGCEETKTVKRPFVIIESDICIGYPSNHYRYRYEDANGLIHSFEDTIKYQIGDTLK